jgi:hypothetical protein
MGAGKWVWVELALLCPWCVCPCCVGRRALPRSGLCPAVAPATAVASAPLSHTAPCSTWPSRVFPTLPCTPCGVTHASALPSLPSPTCVYACENFRVCVCAMPCWDRLLWLCVCVCAHARYRQAV